MARVSTSSHFAAGGMPAGLPGEAAGGHLAGVGEDRFSGVRLTVSHHHLRLGQVIRTGGTGIPLPEFQELTVASTWKRPWTFIITDVDARSIGRAGRNKSPILGGYSG